ncbi:uncharacterized protein BYT42DRAFT_560151 [Radiomyces spectabilis]|uniref:uncharacterized protein n=1 Tax=Radiomyces spectabilis TaxID=64574 RepID=UPI00221EB07B|nr:uncharacterized protein BYT42DRAFT_560151 [Radiomyces spectabilis]KAI8388456.1 hypothetical protein BYT42DRAFT_560151 [Radiomyces spectabilis]
MSAMDTSDEDLRMPPSVVSTAQTNSSLSISVHPLVLLNISDHYTRTKLQNPDAVQKGHVHGALLAKQSGREIDIINSFELPPVIQEGIDVLTVDKAYLANKQEQMRQVFPNLDFMGWYSLGAFPTEKDLKVHEQFLQVNESALFLQMDPVSLAAGSKEFPVVIYESIMDLDDETPRLMFVKSAYKVETEEAERIAVDHVAKPSTSSAESGVGNALIAHLTTQRNAVAMLHSRLQVLQQYLQDVKAGVIPTNHDIVRQIASLCRRSPVVDTKAFDEQFSTEFNDVLLVGYLGTITKGLNAINDLIDKFNLLYGATGASAGRTVTPIKKGRRMAFEEPTQ